MFVRCENYWIEKVPLPAKLDYVNGLVQYLVSSIFFFAELLPKWTECSRISLFYRPQLGTDWSARGQLPDSFFFFVKGGNFGAKFTLLRGFWLDVSFFSHVKKHRSLLWLAATRLRMKISVVRHKSEKITRLKLSDRIKKIREFFTPQKI